MKGRILSYSVQANSGEISGDDGNRYVFTGQDWQETQLPQRGMFVDFVAEGDKATSVYAALPDTGAATAASTTPPHLGNTPAAGTPPNVGNAAAIPVGSKSKTTAGILALLLGVFGIHKFYLGYAGPGILVLLVGVFTCSIAWIITGPIALIEGILYLTKTDEEFDRIYVQGSRSFF